MNLCKAHGVRPSLMTLTLMSTLLAGFPAMADELIMKDGSHLLGKVVKRDKGDTINFKTSYAGVIQVKWTEVRELVIGEPMTLLLENGETRKVTSVRNTEAGIMTSDESGAVETFPINEVAYVNPEPWRLGESWNWVGKVNLDLNYERGNTDKDEYIGDFTTTFRKIEHRIKFNGDYDREKNRGVLTDDEWRLSGRYDLFVNKQLYYGATLGLEHDRFADISLRTITGPLVGYEFYESKAMNIDVAAGPLYIHENFYDDVNRDYLAFGWHFDFNRFLIPDRVQFYHRHGGLLEAEDTDNLVWNAWTGFRFPIYAGIVASTEVLVEYDGGANTGIDDTDTTYNVKLGYQW